MYKAQKTSISQKLKAGIYRETHRDLFSSEGLSGMEASEGSMLTSEVILEAAGG